MLLLQFRHKASLTQESYAGDGTCLEEYVFIFGSSFSPCFLVAMPLGSQRLSSAMPLGSTHISEEGLGDCMCVTRSRFLPGAHERAVHKAVRVKSKVEWNLRKLEMQGTWNIY